MIKRILYNLMPPIIWKLYGRFRKKRPVDAERQETDMPAYIPWQGPISSWEEAEKLSTGYSSSAILEKVLEASLKVKNGEYAYERDSVNFETIQYAWPLAACLLYAAGRNKNKLELIDFGGSLGTTYFQNRSLLENVREFRWKVVEQEHFVEAGNKHIASGALSFHKDMKSAIESGTPDVLLSSGAFQYIREYRTILDNLLKNGFPFVLLDRIPVYRGDTDMIYIQNVPEEIYTASYPTYFFSETAFLRIFEGRYRLISDFNSECDAPLKLETGQFITWKGYFFEKLEDVN